MTNKPDNEFYALLNFLPIPIMVSEDINQDTSVPQVNRICFLNKAFIDTIGYTLDDIPDADTWHKKAFPVEAHRKNVLRDWHDISTEKLSRAQTVIEFTAKICCNDGIYRWFEVTNELQSSVKPNYNVSVFNDITKLRDMYDDLKAKTLKIAEQTTEIHALRKIIPICSICKRIKDGEGYWQEVESYIKERSGADLTHSLCAKCFKSHYPDIYESCKDELNLDEKS